MINLFTSYRDRFITLGKILLANSRMNCFFRKSKRNCPNSVSQFFPSFRSIERDTENPRNMLKPSGLINTLESKKELSERHCSVPLTLSAL